MGWSLVFWSSELKHFPPRCFPNLSFLVRKFCSFGTGLRPLRTMQLEGFQAWAQTRAHPYTSVGSPQRLRTYTKKWWWRTEAGTYLHFSWQIAERLWLLRYKLSNPSKRKEGGEICGLRLYFSRNLEKEKCSSGTKKGFLLIY